MKMYNVNVCLNGVVLKAKNRQDLQTVGANVQHTTIASCQAFR